MASEKITQMPTAVALGGTEFFPMVQNGGNVKATPNQVLALGWNAGSVAAVAGGLALNQGTVVVAEATIGQLITNATTAAITGTYTVGASVSGLNFAMTGGGGGGGGIANAAATGSSGTTAIYMEGWMAVTPGQTLAYSVGGFGPGGAAGNNNGTIGGDTTLGTLTAKGGTPGNGSASGNAAAPSAAPLVLAAKPSPSASLILRAYNATVGAAGSAGVGGTTSTAPLPWVIPGAGGSLAVGGNAGGWGAPGGGAGGTSSGALKGGDGSGGALWIYPKN